MSDAPATRNIIQQEAVVSRRPVSESLVQPIASSLSLLLKEGYETIEWKINKSYKGFVGETGCDLFFRFKYDAFIFAADFFNKTIGTSGTTEVDAKLATVSGGAFNTIFTTTPKVTPAAGDNAWIGTGEVVTGLVAPVLTSPILNVNAGDVLRMDLISAMVGNPQGVQLNLYYLPR